MRRVCVFFLVMSAGLVVAPRHLSGQDLASDQAVTPDAEGVELLAPAGLRASGGLFTVDVASTAEIAFRAGNEASPSLLPQERNRAGVPLMIGGGVLFGAGLIAGGDGGMVLMVGGGVIGAFGAYKYFGGQAGS